MRITLGVTAVFLLLSAVLVPSTTLAQGSSQVFTVRGIEVDVTADGVTAAREQALAQGQVRAMRDLLERLVLPEDQGAIPPLSAAEVQDYVLDFGIADERTSAVQYIATMTVRFRPGAVRRLLRANGLRFAEVQSKPVLVIPVWNEGAGDRLWQGANPWLNAWIAESDFVELVPVLTPLGDLEDLRDIDAAQARTGDSTRLRTIGERYGVDSVLVSYAVQGGDPEIGLGRVQVESRRYRDGLLDATFIDSYSQQPGEDLTALLERAVGAIDRGLQEEWKRANVMSFDALQRLLVEVPVAALSDWLLVRRRLEGLASVAASDLVSLTRQRAVIQLAFYGSLDQLLGQLEQRDLVLMQQDRGFGGGSASVIVSSRGSSGPLPAAQAVAAEAEPEWRLITREAARAETDAGLPAPDAAAGTPGLSPSTPPLDQAAPPLSDALAPGQPLAQPVPAAPTVVQ